MTKRIVGAALTLAAALTLTGCIQEGEVDASFFWNYAELPDGRTVLCLRSELSQGFDCDWESIRKEEGEWPAPTEAPAKPGPASSAK